MKVYRVDQKISIDPLYLKTAMPLVILPIQLVMVAIVILAKDIPTIKQSQPIGCARLIIMPPTNTFEPQPF
jgi:hypothetical protein